MVDLEDPIVRILNILYYPIHLLSVFSRTVSIGISIFDIHTFILSCSVNSLVSCRADTHSITPFSVDYICISPLTIARNPITIQA